MLQSVFASIVVNIHHSHNIARDVAGVATASGDGHKPVAGQ